MKHETLFDAPANRSVIQTFNCSGFHRPVVGTVYPRASFRWHGVPLGGLGTGYVTLDQWPQRGTSGYNGPMSLTELHRFGGTGDGQWSRETSRP